MSMWLKWRYKEALMTPPPFPSQIFRPFSPLECEHFWGLHTFLTLTGRYATNLFKQCCDRPDYTSKYRQKKMPISQTHKNDDKENDKENISG